MIMSNFRRLSGCLLLVCSIMSTDVAAQTPACADLQTVELVKKTFLNSVDKTVSATGASQTEQRKIIERVRAWQLQLSAIRTVRINKTVGRHSCQANLTVMISPELASIINEPGMRRAFLKDPKAQGLDLDGQRMSALIQYVSQMTDDRNQQIVELDSHQNLRDSTAGAAMADLARTESRAGNTVVR